MLKLIISVVGCIFVAGLLGKGEAVRCYHCYESYSNMSLRSFDNADLGSSFIRCDKNKNNWNTWVCPVEFPVCVIMLGTVKDHIEIVRSCAKKDICETYKPPPGVTLESCRECSTTLCNDYMELPTPPPPVNPDALFNFNININLNVKKYPRINNEDLK